MENLEHKPQKELEEMLKSYEVDSKEYKRVKDLILRIQLNTNNQQTAHLIGEVRIESKNAEKHARYALWFAGLSLLISAWQFLIPVSLGFQRCYVGATVGDKVTRMNCSSWIRIGQAINLGWDTSYDVK